MKFDGWLHIVVATQPTIFRRADGPTYLAVNPKGDSAMNNADLWSEGSPMFEALRPLTIPPMEEGQYVLLVQPYHCRVISRPVCAPHMFGNR